MVGMWNGVARLMNKFLQIIFVFFFCLASQNSHAQWVNESSTNKMDDSIDLISSISSKSGAKTKLVVRCNSKKESAHINLQFPRPVAYNSLKIRVGNQDAQVFEGSLSPDGRIYTTIYDAVLILRLQEESLKRLLVEVQWLNPSNSEVIEFNLQGFNSLPCIKKYANKNA